MWACSLAALNWGAEVLCSPVRCTEEQAGAQPPPVPEPAAVQMWGRGPDVPCPAAATADVPLAF